MVDSKNISLIIIGPNHVASQQFIETLKIGFSVTDSNSDAGSKISFSYHEYNFTVYRATEDVGGNNMTVNDIGNDARLAVLYLYDLMLQPQLQLQECKRYVAAAGDKYPTASLLLFGVGDDISIDNSWASMLSVCSYTVSNDLSLLMTHDIPTKKVVSVEGGVAGDSRLLHILWLIIDKLEASDKGNAELDLAQLLA